VTETGLIIAEVAFLVLLYAFVWTVVRSASRQMPGTQAPPPAPPVPEPEPERAPPRPRREVAMAAAPAAPSVPPAPALPPPVEIPQPTAEPLGGPPDPAPEPAGDASELRTVIPPEGIRLDLSANLDPRLVVESSPSLAPGREIPLEGGITIGRSEAAGLSIADQFVSHMHARILKRGPYHFVEDLGSTNGTFLNDRRVERDAQLKVRDSLRIGQTILRYEE
jgi:hypothetical protein